MSYYPYLVQTGWNVVERFLLDWQRQPYRWEHEIDVNAEIFSRLSTIYRLIGKDTIVGNYPNAVLGFEHKQEWSRAACQPCVSYTYSDKSKCHCYPDIVIWDDIEDPNSPPDLHGDNWPILWACEIKYGQQTPSDWDLKKLRYLISQKHIKYGCWLKMSLVRADYGSGLEWDRDQEEAKLWICEARLPSQK